MLNPLKSVFPTKFLKLSMLFISSINLSKIWGKNALSEKTDLTNLPETLICLVNSCCISRKYRSPLTSCHQSRCFFLPLCGIMGGHCLFVFFLFLRIYLGVDLWSTCWFRWEAVVGQVVLVSRELGVEVMKNDKSSKASERQDIRVKHSILY